MSSWKGHTCVLHTNFFHMKLSIDWATNIIIFQFQRTTRKIQGGTYCFHFTPTKNIKSHQRDIHNHTSPWFICRFKPSKLCATLLISSHLYQNLYFANWDTVYKKQKKEIYALSLKTCSSKRNKWQRCNLFIKDWYLSSLTTKGPYLF